MRRGGHCQDLTGLWILYQNGGRACAGGLQGFIGQLFHGGLHFAVDGELQIGPSRVVIGVFYAGWVILDVNALFVAGEELIVLGFNTVETLAGFSIQKRIEAKNI